MRDLFSIFVPPANLGLARRPSGFALRVRQLLYLGSPQDPYGFALWVRHLLYLGRPQDPKGFALRVRHLLYLGRPQDRSGLTSCSTWGDPKTARGIRAVAHQLLYLGRPQDRTGSPHWLPKTALAHHPGCGTSKLQLCSMAIVLFYMCKIEIVPIATPVHNKGHLL